MWRLGSDTGYNNKKCLLNNDITNVLEYLTNTNNNCNRCRGNPTKINSTYGIADTGATQNFIKVNTPCSNKVKTTPGPRFILLDGSLMHGTHKAELNLSPLLPTRAKKAHISPHLQSGAIISIEKLCDDGCTETSTVTTMAVNKQGEVVLEGNRYGVSGMWKVQLTPPHPIPTPTHQSENIFMADITKPSLAQWYHATLFSPVKQNLIQAIKKVYLATCPKLTSQLINNHLPPLMATSMVRMHQTRKDLNSTTTQ